MRFRFAFCCALLAACDASSDAPTDTTVAPGKVYVADEDSGTVSVIDVTTNTRVAVVELGLPGMMFMPHNVQAAPDGHSIWVVAPPMEGHASDEEQVVVIDPTSDAIVWRASLGEHLHLAHVVLDDASAHAFVTANETGQVFRVDAQTHAVDVLAELGAAAKPHGVRACGGELYVAEMGALGVAVIDQVTGEVSDVPTGGVTVQSACTRDGRWAFATLYDTREVVRIDVATHAVTRIALPAGAQGPVQLYPAPDSKRVYVCDQGTLMDRPASNRLYEIDVAKAEVTATITVGQGAHGVVVSEDARRAYVTNLLDDTVSVVDTAERAEVAVIPVGHKPNGIAHWHVTGGMP